MPKHESAGGQEKAQRTRGEVEESIGETAVNSEVAERHEKLTEDVDALLDEIDGVLETNAEDFVRNYVQKGGQ